MKKLKIWKRTVAGLLSLLLVAGAFPANVGGVKLPGVKSISAEATDEWTKTAANTTLGTTGIEKPSTSSSVSAWTGSFVYYGKYNGTPTKYRVLDPNSDAFGVNGGSLFLDCNTTLYSSTTAVNWTNSPVRTWLQGDNFYNSNDVFTPVERSAIAQSTTQLPNEIFKYYQSSDSWDYVSCNTVNLSAEQVFLLDAREATNNNYGYTCLNARRKTGNTYWIRSTVNASNGTSTVRQMSYVANNGRFGYSTNSSLSNYVSPAFNVSLSDVLLSSQVNDVTTQYGKEYKLTIKDESLTVAVTEGQKVGNRRGVVTIPFTITDTETENGITPDCVTYLIKRTTKATAETEESSEILAYEKLDLGNSELEFTEGTATGTGSFNLPADFQQDPYADSTYYDTVYILAEKTNIGDSKNLTDYASDMKKIPIPMHEHSFTYAPNEAVLTATCNETETDCPLDNHEITLSLSPATYLDYDGTAKAATLENLANFNSETGLTIADTSIKYYKKNGNEWEELTGAPTNAGTYKAELTTTIGETPYTIYSEFAITQAANGYNIEPAGTTDSLTYNGSPQALLGNEPTAQFGTIQYKVDDGAYSTDAPTATSAGEHTVYYKVVGNADYADIAESSFTVSIAAKNMSSTDITAELAPTPVDYDSNAHTPTLTVKDTSLSTDKQVLTADDYTSDLAAQTAAGEYTVTITGQGNYTGTKTATWNINKIANTGTVSIADKVYDGAVVDPVATPAETLTEGTSITYTYYKLGANNSETELDSAPKDVGQYKVVASFPASTNYNSGTAEDTFEITKRPVTITPTAKTVTYGTAKDANGGLGLTFTTNTGDNVGVIGDDSALFTNVTAFLTAEGYDAAEGVVDEDGYQIILRDAFIEGTGDYANDAYDYSNYEITLDTTEDVYLTVTPISADDDRIVVTFSADYQAKGGLIYTGKKQPIKNHITVSYPTNVWGVNYTANDWDLDGEKTIKDAGNYTAILSFNDEDNYTGTREVPWKILPAQIDTTGFTYTVADVTYGATPSYELTLTEAPFSTLTNPTATYTFYKKNADDTYTELTNPHTAPTDAGDYKVKAEVIGNGGNSGATVEDEFKINALDISTNESLTVTPTAYTYTGSAITPTFTVKLGDTPLVAGTDYEVTATAQTDTISETNAGNYTATITFKGNYSGTKATTWSISKDTIATTDVTAPTAKDGDDTPVYSGNGQPLVNGGNSTTAGTQMKYYVISEADLKTALAALNPSTNLAEATSEQINAYFNTLKNGNTNPFDSTLPQKTNAGTYYVAYYVDGGTNFNDTEIAFLTVSIAKATPTITAPTASAITYGQTLANSTLRGGGASVAGAFAWKVDTTAPAVSDSQTTEYDVVFNPTDTVNYNTASCKVKLTVNKSVATCTAPTAKTDLVYDGTAKDLINAGSSTDGTMVYSLTEDGTYTDTIPKGIKADNYIVYYKVIGDANHSDSASQSVNVTLEKATITSITITMESWTFNSTPSTPSTPSVSGNPGNGEVTYVYYTDAACTTKTTPENSGAESDGLIPRNAGTYHVKASIAETANYKEGIATAGFTISKGTLSPTVSLDGWTYGSTQNDPSVDNVTVSIGDVTYVYYTDAACTTKTTPENSGAATEGGKPTYAGTYRVKATISQSTNYNSATAEASFTIAPKPVTVTPNANQSKTYGENDPATYGYSVDALENGDTLNGAMGRTEGENAGTYAFTIGTLANSNYTLTLAAGENVPVFTINPKAVNTPAITINGTYTYTGNAIEPTNVVVKDGDTVIDPSEYTLTYSNNTNACAFDAAANAPTVTITDKANGNYTVNGSATFTIAKATPTVTPPRGKTLTSNGSEQQLIIAGSTNGGEMQYALGNETAPTGTWTATIADIKGKDVGTYYVWYKVVGNDNYNGTDAVCITAKINAYIPYTPPVYTMEDQEWTISIDSYEYDGTAHTPTINGTTYGTKTYTYYDADTGNKLNGAPSAVGNYRVEVYAAGNSSYNGRTQTAEYSITAKPEPPAPTEYTINVKNGTINGKTTGTYEPNKVLVAKADIAPAGYKFAYWKKNGETASYSESYTFPLSRDMELEAVYTLIDDEFQPDSTGQLDGFTSDKENGKLQIAVLHSVPQDCKILKAGLVATSDTSKLNNLTAANADYVKYKEKITVHNFKYTWTKTQVTADQTWYVRSYLEYKDADGKIKVVYGDMVQATLDGYKVQVENKIVGTSNMGDVVKDTENNKLSFAALLNVPVDCTIKFAGVVATSDASKVSELTKIKVAEKAMVNGIYVRGMTSDKHTVKYTWTKTEVGSETWYVRSYLVYVDSHGNEQIVYGDLTTAKLN